MKLFNLFIIIFLGLAVSSSTYAQSNGGDLDSSKVIEVIHTPLSVNEVPEDLIEKIQHPYVRFYRTDVINHSDRAIKIVWFDGFFDLQGQWIAVNVRNRVLRNKDFMDWYGSDNLTPDGWLRAGGTASCSVNWHYADTPQEIKTKWAYIGVDEQGNDYFSESVVPAIRPVKIK